MTVIYELARLAFDRWPGHGARQASERRTWRASRRREHHESDLEASERDAFNAAFRELGLRWHWGPELFHSLKRAGDDAARVRNYLEQHEPHLLRAYDATFLVDAICAAKSRSAAGGRESPLPGAGRCADCSDYATAQTGF